MQCLDAVKIEGRLRRGKLAPSEVSPIGSTLALLVIMTNPDGQAIVAALEPPAPKKKSHKCLLL